METTIQVSKELLERLRSMKMDAKESYESIIWDLVEDRLSFSPQTLKNIEIAKKEIAEGKGISLEEAKRRRGL
jgi:predicted CopG family antitoxin